VAGAQFGQDRHGVGMPFEQLEQHQVLPGDSGQALPAAQRIASARQRQIGQPLLDTARQDST
jgi:hypothetical protein